MKKENPLKAIRTKCLECSCGSMLEVRECAIADCALYPYRFGKNPFRVHRSMSEEQRHALGERLLNARKGHAESMGM